MGMGLGGNEHSAFPISHPQVN